MNLSEMSLRELKGLLKKIDAAVASFEDRKLQEARVQLETKAKELGFNLSALMNSDKRSTRSPVKAKWRHREDHSLTWSGRGRKPNWLPDAEPIPDTE